MEKFKLQKLAGLLAAMVILSSCATMRNNVPVLDTPTDFAFNRGIGTATAPNWPVGLSWADVDDRVTFSLYVFRNAVQSNPNQAYRVVEGIDALSFNVFTELAEELSDGPFWFRVQAVGVETDVSALSEAIGPYWYVASPIPILQASQSLALFTDPAIPVLLIDTRRAGGEREAQGHVAGDVNVVWPLNQLALDEGATHATFQEGVLAAWQSFIANDLTAAQRATLNPALAYRDIHIFIYCWVGGRTPSAARSVATLGFTNVYDIGGFGSGTTIRNVFPTVGWP